MGIFEYGRSKVKVVFPLLQGCTPCPSDGPGSGVWQELAQLFSIALRGLQNYESLATSVLCVTGWLEALLKLSRAELREPFVDLLRVV